MARRRTDEEMKEIYMACCELLHTDGEKAVIDYLESMNYVTPKATWANMQRSEAFMNAEKEYRKNGYKKAETKTEVKEEPVMEEAKVVTEGKEEPAEDEKEKVKVEMPKPMVQKQIKMVPRGLKSQYEWRSERMNDIMQAMARYTLADVLIPIDWICELGDLIGRRVDILQAALDNSGELEVKEND